MKTKIKIIFCNRIRQSRFVTTLWGFSKKKGGEWTGDLGGFVVFFVFIIFLIIYNNLNDIIYSHVLEIVGKKL